MTDLGYIYKRIIRFQDTDAAGVVYFANILAMGHEAYEASLNQVEINLKSFLLILILRFQLFMRVLIFGFPYSVEIKF